MAKLTLDDISDLRAYERERVGFRREVIALKKRRRAPLGEVVTLLFENRVTVRFQVQEMARAERLITDAAVETELRTYNPLVPDPGQVCATLFVELTSDDMLRTWLPRLVGIETAVGLRLADGTVVGGGVAEGPAPHLPPAAVTAAGHNQRGVLSPEEVEAFAVGPVALVSTHPDYPAETTLGEDAHAELLGDLRHGG
jgi:hypothetical protein